MKELQGKVAHASLPHPRDRKKPMWLGAVMEEVTGRRGGGRGDGAREGGDGLLWTGAQNRWVLSSNSHLESTTCTLQGEGIPKRVRNSPEGWGRGHKSGVLKATHSLESQRRWAP